MWLGIARKLIWSCLWLSAAAHAETGLLHDALGRWLNTSVAPQLTELLSQHPKFKGETVRFVAMQDGKPLAKASRLHQAVEEHLTQLLLRNPGVRLAWNQTSETCGAPMLIPYLLGVEIERDGSRSHQLNISMVDVEESIWVSGANFTWKGRLTTAEKTALRKEFVLPPKGTVDSPLPVSAGDQIADIMQRHLHCALPDGLDGPLYLDLEVKESRQLTRILGQLHKDLIITPIGAVTSDKTEARWLLSLHASPLGKQTHELSLTLSDAAQENTQRLASVFVIGLDGRPGEPKPRSPQVGELLSGLAYSDSLEPSDSAGRVCTRRQVKANKCVEISFEVLSPAYLFVLSSTGRSLRSTSCRRSPRLAESGERTFRLRITPSASPQTADAGFYAIAVNDRNVARDLARHIARGPCEANQSWDYRGWLGSLERLLAKHEGAYQWRAMHLNHTPQGITEL